MFVKDPFARWTGVIVLGLNAIAQLLLTPAYPFSSPPTLALGLFAIFALMSCGQEVVSAVDPERLI